MSVLVAFVQENRWAMRRDDLFYDNYLEEEEKETKLVLNSGISIVMQIKLVSKWHREIAFTHEACHLIHNPSGFNRCMNSCDRIITG